MTARRRYTVVIAVGMAAVAPFDRGLAFESQEMEIRSNDVGLHMTEAVVVSGLATALVKGIAGRARPFVVGDDRPGDFAFGRGFLRGGAYPAFPSGHTTVAFASAAVGTLVGRKVVRYQHSHPGNRVDRWLLATTIAPGRDGPTPGWSTRYAARVI